MNICDKFNHNNNKSAKQFRSAEREQNVRPKAYSLHAYFKRFVFYKFYSSPVVSEPQSAPETSKTAFTGDLQLPRENTVDTSCASGNSLVNDTSQDNSETFNLPSHSKAQDVVSNHIQSTSRKPLVFRSGVPTMVQYGQSSVVPENAKVDQRITSQIQLQDQFSAWQSSGNSRPVSFLSNTVNPQSRLESNTTSFQPNSSLLHLPNLQSFTVDPPSSLPRFQFKDPYARSHSASFQFNAVDSLCRQAFHFHSNRDETRPNLSGYQSATSARFSGANFQSKFIQDNLNYFPRAQTAPYSVERRNMGANTADTGEHQSLYMSGSTYENVVHQSRPSPGHFATSLPVTMATPDVPVFLPTERLGSTDNRRTFSLGSDDAKNVFGPSYSPIVSDLGIREGSGSKYTPELWPNAYTTEEGKKLLTNSKTALLSPPEWDNGSSECNSDFWPNVSTRSAYGFQDYDRQVISYVPPSITSNSALPRDTQWKNSYQNVNIKQEHRSPCRFEDSSRENTLPHISDKDIQSYPKLDSPEDISPEKYFGDDLSIGCTIPTESTRHTQAMDAENVTKVIHIPLCATGPVLPLMSNPIYTFPTANQTKSSYLCAPTYLTLQPLPPLAYPAAYPYLTDPAHQRRPVSSTVPEYPKSLVKINKNNRTEPQHSSPSSHASDDMSSEHSDVVAFKVRKVDEETCQKNNEKTKMVQNSAQATTINATGGSSCCNSALTSSPSVFEAACILSNPDLQLWRTSNNPVSSKRSLMKAFDEASASRSQPTRSDTVHASQLEKEKKEEGSGLQFRRNQNIVSSCSSLPVSHHEEISFHNVTSTHKTVALQVQATNTKPLQRPHFCIPKQSTACQTQELAPCSSTAKAKIDESLQLETGSQEEETE